jgi:hypothetical protein
MPTSMPAAMAAANRSLFPVMSPPATLGFIMNYHAECVIEG